MHNAFWGHTLVVIGWLQLMHWETWGNSCSLKEKKSRRRRSPHLGGTLFFNMSISLAPNWTWGWPQGDFMVRNSLSGEPTRKMKSLMDLVFHRHLEFVMLRYICNSTWVHDGMCWHAAYSDQRTPWEGNRHRLFMCLSQFLPLEAAISQIFQTGNAVDSTSDNMSWGARRLPYPVGLQWVSQGVDKNSVKNGKPVR